MVKGNPAQLELHIQYSGMDCMAFCEMKPLHDFVQRINIRNISNGTQANCVQINALRIELTLYIFNPRHEYAACAYIPTNRAERDGGGAVVLFTLIVFVMVA